jgi:hypothetical protein
MNNLKLQQLAQLGKSLTDNEVLVLITRDENIPHNQDAVSNVVDLMHQIREKYWETFSIIPENVNFDEIDALVRAIALTVCAEAGVNAQALFLAESNGILRLFTAIYLASILHILLDTEVL